MARHDRSNRQNNGNEPARNRRNPNHSSANNMPSQSFTADMGHFGVAPVNAHAPASLPTAIPGVSPLF